MEPTTADLAYAYAALERAPARDRERYRRRREHVLEYQRQRYATHKDAILARRRAARAAVSSDPGLPLVAAALDPGCDPLRGAPGAPGGQN